MKLMRGYRFRREALKMLKVFLLVWFGGFLLEAGFDWLRGKDPSIPLIALVVSSILFMVFAAVLFAIDATIQAVEKRQKPWHGGDRF